MPAAAARRRTPGAPELGPPGRRADQPPLPGPLRPAPDPARGRRGDRWRRPFRHPRERVPVLPGSPRRAGAWTASSGRTAHLSASHPSLRARLRVVDRSPGHEADFGRATDAETASSPRRSAKCWAARGLAARRTASSCTPRRWRGGRRDLPLALGDPPAPGRDRRPRARHRPAGELGQPRGGDRPAVRRFGREDDGERPDPCADGSPAASERARCIAPRKAGAGR